MWPLIVQCITHDTNEISPMEGMFFDFPQFLRYTSPMDHKKVLK